MAMNFLEFEQPIAELEAKIEELKFLGTDSSVNISEEIKRLQAKSRALTTNIFQNLTPWQITQFARHPQRPYTLDYVSMIFTDWQELHGDRMYGDDLAIVGGLARIEGIAGHADRPSKGARHQGAGAPQLRHAEAGGLSQGAAPDDDGRTLPAADRHADRHAGRLSRHRLGGARSERGDRAQFVRDVALGGADPVGRDRRGRLGRRARDRRVRPLGHAAVHRVLGHFAGELRVDLVEEHRQEGNRRRCDGRHGRTAEEARSRRRGAEGAAWRRRIATRGHGRNPEGSASSNSSRSCGRPAGHAIARCEAGALALVRRVSATPERP